MENTNTINKSKTLLFVFGVCLALFFIAILIISFISSDRNLQSPQTAPLSQKELSYTEAKDQQYTQTSQGYGILVVTSEPDQAEVKIDEKEVKNPSFYAPTNKTPFIVKKIPVGNHVIRTSLPGYIVSEITINVLANQVSRANLTLALDNNYLALQKLEAIMPIKTDDYTIEYFPFTKKVQVFVNKPPFDQSKQKAINYFKQNGVSNPEAEGVVFNDLTNQPVQQGHT